MAIYHLSMKPIARNAGRSAVAAAAYRSGSRLVNERDGLVHDYSRKSGIAHAEIVTPDGVNADWAHDRSALWNAAEFAERRKDARVAREFEVALPHELTDAERLELTRAFAQSLSNRFGTAVDFAIHSPDDATDIRNHHAHIMMTTRAVTPDGLADKTALERENKYLIDNGLPTSQAQLRDVRLEWEQLTNEHLARAGHDVRVDHRSHLDRGLELEPTQHMGVHASQMQSHGKSVERARIDHDAARRNADLIREKPDTVLNIITDEKSVFDKRDIARTLHRYINDDPAEYQVLLTKVMASPQLTKLRETDGPTPAKYSTKEMIEVETGMAADALAMNVSGNHPVDPRHISRAIHTQDQAIQRTANADIARKVAQGEMTEAQAQRDWKPSGLSTEQVEAIEHVTSDQQISVVVGYAGAGKSTMLAAAREAWEAQGYTVHGAALAGKAAEGLEESSGISSRTLASWAYRWNKEENLLGPNDVLVIDEAGMVGSRQLSGFISEAREAGAKIVLVGDHEQLQAIGAGAAFRSIAESVGFAQLSDVRRQREDWQREASVALASHRTSEALGAYDKRGHIHLDDTADRARARLVDDYITDVKLRPEGTRMAMAHRKADVQALNADIRDRLRNESELSDVQRPSEMRFQTENGERDFAPGDRLAFLSNDRKLGVKNGMLGTVERVGEGRLIVRPDGKSQAVEIDAEAYKAFDYGYATTIHKTQGATVDKAYVLASNTMDRHLTYVAMTRHRDTAEVYADHEAFRDKDALKARLSRSGAKETTLDYLEVGEGGFATRRGFEADAAERNDFIHSRGEATRRDRPAPRSADQWGMTDHLATSEDTRNEGVGNRRSPISNSDGRGKAIPRDHLAPLHGDGSLGSRDYGRSGLARGEIDSNDQTPVSRIDDQGVTDPSGHQRFIAAVDRFTDNYLAGISQMRGRTDVEITPDVRAAGHEALIEMDALRPGSRALIKSAMHHDTDMHRAMMTLSGPDRTAALLNGMIREQAAQRDPNVRADRAIAEWHKLSKAAGGGSSLYGERARLERDQRAWIKAVKHDPEVEKVIATRIHELGIGKAREGQDVHKDIERQIKRDRDRGRER